MTKLNWNEEYTYNHAQITEWESTCGNFRIHKLDSRFFINKKVMVELYDINDEMFEEETMILCGNKEGYSTLEQAQNACIEEV